MRELPSNWILVNFNLVSNKITDGTHHTPNYTVSGVPFLSVKNIRNDSIDFDNCKYISLNDHNQLMKRCNPGYRDILLTKSGTIGRTAVIKTKMEFSLFVSVALLKLKQDLLNPFFTKYYFDYYFSKTNIQQTVKGGVIKNLHLEDINKLPIYLPPLPEQQRIVAKIEELFTKLDAGVAALQKAKALLKQYRQSVLKAAVEGKLTEEWRRENGKRIETASVLLERIQAERKQRLGSKYKPPKPVDSSNLPDLPDGWVWATWEDILSNEDGAFKRGPFGSSLKKSMFVESGYKVYEQYCPINDDCSFERYFITEQKYKEMESFAVQAGDYLISCSGSLGKITQVPSQFKKGIINQALLRVRINTKFYSAPFFMHFFGSPYFQKQLLTNTTGSAIQNLKGVRELKAIPIPLMSIQEQDIIVKEIDRLFSIIDESELIINTELKHSQSLRQSILKRAFEGKLVPQDPNDEPVSVLLERIKHVNKLNVG